MSVDSSSAREPTIRGRRVESPLQVAQFVEEVIKRQMRSALSPEDTMLMERANKKLLTHATVGLAAGSMCGTLLAFRGRWAASRRMAANGSVAQRGAEPAGKSFYPSKAVQDGTASAGGASGSAKVSGDMPNRNKLWFIAKGLGFGMAGAMLGSVLIGKTLSSTRADQICV